MFERVAPVGAAFYTATSLGTARSLALEAILNEGGEVKVQSDRQIVAEFGSEAKARTLGVPLAGIKVMPRDITVSLEPVEDRTLIRVQVRDTFGFGTRLGVAGKLADLMQQNVLAVQSAFPDATPAVDLPAEPVQEGLSPSPSGVANTLEATSSAQAEYLASRAQQGSVVPYPQQVPGSLKARSTAILLEILAGNIGLFGIGWLYGGNTNTGLPLLVGGAVWDFICLVTAIFTGGLFCLCALPVNLVVVVLSVTRLEAYAKRHPELLR